MKSENKLRITATKMPEFDDKFWITVEFLQHIDGSWIPSLEDLCRILRAIAYCEDLKYPPPNYKGRFMLVDFLKEAITNPEVPFTVLASKYMIPRIGE